MGAPARSRDRAPMANPVVFDEQNARGFRARFHDELREAWNVSMAVKRLRLSAIDVSDEDLRRIRTARLVLAQVRAAALDAEAHALMARPDARRRLEIILRLMADGRMRVRVAPLGGWSPDFTVFADARGPRSVLLGFHQFERTHPYPGPTLGVQFGRRGALLAHRRFHDIWNRSHDVLPAVQSILARAHRWGGLPEPVDTLRALG